MRKPFNAESQEHSEGGKFGKEYHTKVMEDMSLEEMYAESASFSDMSGGFTDPEIVNPEIASPHGNNLDRNNVDNTGGSPKNLGSGKVSGRDGPPSQALQCQPSNVMQGKFMVRLLSSSNSSNKLSGPTLPMFADNSSGRQGQQNSENFQGRDVSGNFMLQQHNTRQADFFGAHNRTGVRAEAASGSCMPGQELGVAVSHNQGPTTWTTSGC